MEKRKFEKLGVESSLLGFGCMRFPLDDNGNIDEKEAERMIDYAMENGVTYIDTAYPYHNGDSEPFVGKVLKKYPRDSFTLATKLPVWNIQSKEDARKLFESQLQRLDVEYVDFYLLHALDAKKWEKILEYHIIELCEELRQEGKIKYLGFSFHDEYPVFEKILTHYDWDFCQLQLNYMDMGIQAGMKGVELANKHHIPLVVMEPIKGGSLASLPEDVTQMFKGYNSKATLASWALRYVGTLPGVKVILSGMSTMEQVKNNVETFTHYQNLSQEELDIVNEVAGTLHSRTQNGCTGCGYCMPCPFGVNIPNNFRYWNNCFIYDDRETFQGKYEKMSDEEKALNCKECGACERMCPQQLPIREDLKRVVKDFERLETERLILRPFQEEDLDAIYEIFSNEKVNTYLPWYALKSKEEAKVFYEDRFANTKDYKYAICLKENNVPIGYIHVSTEDHHDFGYGLLEKYWRQGIVSEAGKAVIEQAKKDGIPYITATHDVNNEYSGYVMKALGMTYQYTYEEMWQPKNFLVHFRMYQLNFDGSDFVYKKYWNMYENHFIEENV